MLCEYLRDKHLEVSWGDSSTTRPLGIEHLIFLAYLTSACSDAKSIIYVGIFFGFLGHVVHTCVLKTPLLWENKGTTKTIQNNWKCLLRRSTNVFFSDALLMSRGKTTICTITHTHIHTYTHTHIRTHTHTHTHAHAQRVCVFVYVSVCLSVFVCVGNVRIVKSTTFFWLSCFQIILNFW